MPSRKIKVQPSPTERALTALESYFFRNFLPTVLLARVGIKCRGVEISEYCDRLKKMITDLDTKRKNEIYECVLDNRMQIGTDHKYAIFDLPGSSGEKMRYFYTFYLDKDRFIQIVSDCVKTEGFCGDTESTLDVIVRSIRSR